jgi:4-carboxymuconolactone decarboxylase
VTETERRLVAISAALPVGRGAPLAAALRAAAGDDRVAVEEVLLQSYLFLGFPAALNGMSLWRKVLPAAAVPPPVAGRRGDELLSWRARGEEVCSQVYAGQYDRLRAHVSALHPELEAWMLEEGYGKVLGRPGLGLRVRELCVVALLAGLDAVPQLFAHLRGALNVGASEADVAETLALAAQVHGPARAAAAAQVWARVKSRHGSG